MPPVDMDAQRRALHATVGSGEIHVKPPGWAGVRVWLLVYRLPGLPEVYPIARKLLAKSLLCSDESPRRQKPRVFE